MSTDNPFSQSGVVVVGSDNHNESAYTTTGTQKIAPRIVGSKADFDAMKSKILAHALGAGATMIDTQEVPQPVKVAPKKVVKKQTIKQAAPQRVKPIVKNKEEELVFTEQGIEPQPTFQAAAPAQPLIHQYVRPKKVVTFKNAMGQIKLEVDGVLVNNFGIGLVFENENKIGFTPADHSDFEVSYDSSKFTVMFTGIIFPWLDGVKQIMVLVNTQVNDE